MPIEFRAGLPALVVLGLAATTGGCVDADGRAGAPSVTERDSAGVRIVELSDVYRATLPEWPLVGPTLVIGEVAGPPERNLFNVAGVTLLADGRVAVANAGTSEVRLFDRSGRYLESIGRQGEGPGEFAQLSWLGRSGPDTLVAFDSRSRRASWFTDQGELLQTLRIDPWTDEPADPSRFGITMAEPLGIGPSGLLIRGGYSRRGDVGEYRDPFSLALLEQDGPPRTLRTYPGREFYYERSGGAFAGLSPIFGRDTYVAEHGRRIVVGSSDRFELDVYEGASLRMRIVADIDLAPATEAELDSWRQDFRDSASELTGDFGDAVRLAIENAPPRPTPPAFLQLAVDSERSIWIAAPRRRPSDGSGWIVLSATGHPEARVAVPQELQVLEIGADHLVGVRRNELDVEQVVMYGLQRVPQD